MSGDDPESFESDDAALLVPSGASVPIVASIAVGVVLLALGFLRGEPAFARLGSILAVGGGVYGARRARDEQGARELHGRVRATAAGVDLPDGTRVERSAIREGFVRPFRGGRAVVQLARGRARPVAVVVRDVEEGRRLLRALGLDVSQTIARFALPSPVVTDPRWLFGEAAVVVAAAVASSAWHAPGVFQLLVIALVAISLFWRTRVEVGADGVSIAWLGRRRFVPLDEIRACRASSRVRVSRAWRTVLLTLRSGEVIELYVRRGAFDDGRAEAIAERVRGALDARRGGDVAARAALLARGERPVDEWLRAARGIGAGANAGMRVAPVEEDALWRIVEDPTVEGSARVGAAVALRAGSLDASGKARLRRVAGAIVAPSVRAAVERAAEDDDAALEEALGDVEPVRKKA